MILSNPATPILLIAFNRANTVQNQLKRIEGLSARKVRVSIDGPRHSQDEAKVLTVRRIVDSWSQESNHDVSVTINKNNLGLHGHFNQAFHAFFTENRLGLVLEDDIEFRKSYIKFLDSNQDLLLNSNTWSIQGYNPSIGADFDFSNRQEIDFRPTYIHTVSGWAANASSIESFLSASSAINQNLYIEDAIRSFTANLTRDPLLARAIRATWIRKMKRAIAGGGGWDNWWEIAAWKSGRQSLMPTKNLSRESLDQSEGQSHPHMKNGLTWSSGDLELVHPNIRKYDKQDRIEDVNLMQIWGIGRKYAWAHALRIQRELRNHSASRSGADLE